MITVALLLFEEAVPSSVTGVLDLLNGVNEHLLQNGKAVAFRLELVSEKAISQPFAFFRQPARYKSFEQSQPDLIIVPSFQVSNYGVISNHKATVQWIKHRHGQGSEVASLCAGCYFLAEAGLLDGKEATSHWAVMEDMQKRYPAICLRSDLVITDHEGIYTSGGAFSSLKLILYLIEKFCGREMALWSSKMYALELDRSSQAHFAVFTGQHQHEDAQILKAQRYLEQHYREAISLDAVAAFVHMGKRNFIRRFKAATHNTPFQYLQRVRIEVAKKAIESNHQHLSSILEESGYSDEKTFRAIFKRLTGLSPLEYKKKYAR